MALLSHSMTGLVATAGWLLAVLLSGVGLGFVGWRAWRLMRATALWGDLGFDRKTRFGLPPEYRATESATRARRRRRRLTAERKRW